MIIENLSDDTYIERCCVQFNKHKQLMRELIRKWEVVKKLMIFLINHNVSTDELMMRVSKIYFLNNYDLKTRRKTYHLYRKKVKNIKN